MESIELGPQWFLPLFAVAWCVILALLSFIGGWHALAKLYPAQSQTPGESFRFTSMALGAGRAPVTYSNVLFIDLSPEGIGISILLPFRIFHPRLLIPWMAVDECRPEKFWLMTNTAVYLSEPKTRLLFARRVGERVDEYWKRYRLLHGVD